MRLTDVVATSVGDRNAPAAALALAYAEQIDQATHTSLGLAEALRVVTEAVGTAVDTDPAFHAKAHDALAKVAAAVSSVTVIDALGPKLLAALDALLLTPKARAAVKGAVAAPTPATSPLAGLRDEEDEVAKRRAARKSG